MRKSLIVLAMCSLLTGAFAQPKREFRAAWIATVANIDWPSRRGLDTQTQQQEMLKILDRFAELKMNAVIFQIRPTSDAFYQSELEPWSRFLTGEQGKAPNPFYDPLAFVIEEAHKRNIDVHVWLNPYRVLNNEDLSQLSKDHLFFKQPELFVKYGKQYYFDPGRTATRTFLNKVVADIVTRYDVDAIHFDDYFYPYRVKGQDFPDDKSFRDEPRGFAFNQKEEWRRNNVNLVINELNQTIKSIKPWVEFGISPFGVWRNNDKDERGSATKAGVTNYDDLYADILKWLEEGSIDYVVPQLYWEIGKKVADYEVLVEWWSKYSYGKNLYIGLNASGLGSTKHPAWTTGNELARQMRMNELYPEVHGEVFFSGKAVINNNLGLADSLANDFYKYPALVPMNSNVNGEKSAQPTRARLLKENGSTLLLWDKVQDTGGKAVSHYVVYAFQGTKVGDLNNPANIIAITQDNCVDLSKLSTKFVGKYTFVITSFNKYKHESDGEKSLTKRMK